MEVLSPRGRRSVRMNLVSHVTETSSLHLSRVALTIKPAALSSGLLRDYACHDQTDYGMMTVSHGTVL